MSFEIRCVIKGIVQGVSFRFFVKSVAEYMNISGEVKNMKDGSVFVLAQGEKESLEKFIHFLKKGNSKSVVDDVSVSWLEPVKNYNNFNISR